MNNFYSLGLLQIVATYKTTASETKTSLLLTSGWWGLARHFHYVPEILSSFFWTVPTLFSNVKFSPSPSLWYGKYWKLCPDEVVQVAGRACGGNHHPGSIPSPCGNYPASSGHQSGTGFDLAQ
ncbi:hypothetical protein F2Q69_00029726, partial [Brassica cretica]